MKKIWNSLDKDMKNNARNVMFFLLGIMTMAMSSTYTMWLGEKFNLVEHVVEYTNVEVKVPLIDDEATQSVSFIGYANSIVKVSNNVPVKGRQLSDNGLKFIKKNEGLAGKAYWDVNGITVGWGHKINKNDSQWLKSVKVGDEVSKSDADYLLEKDIATMVNPGIRHIIRDLESNGVDTRRLTQGMIDGIGDLIYNCGLGGVKQTEFYRTLRTGNIERAISLVPTTRVYCKGHETRRMNTKILMTGI